MKTIKQIADELGVPKQPVYRFVKKNNIDVHLVDGVMYCDDVAETAIKRTFVYKSVHHEPHKTTSDVMIDMLKNELQIKNEQIKQLTTALENATAALTAAQALHAADKQKLLEIEQRSSEPPRKHWWNFRRKGTEG